jgi:hypothetical protein
LLNGEFNKNDLKSIGIELGVARQLMKFVGKDITLEAKQIKRIDEKEKKKHVDIFLSFTGKEKK